MAEGGDASRDGSLVSAPPAGSADPSIWSYLATIMRRPRLILGLPLVFAAATASLGLLRSREYVAFASFVSQDLSGLQSNIGQLATQFGLVAPRASASSPQFYADLLQSRDILRAVITTQYSVASAGGFRGSLFDYFRMSATDPERAFTDAVPKVLSLADVSADKTTGIVRLQVRTRYPDLSRQVARKFVDEVIAFDQRRRQSAGQAESDFVQQRLREAHDGLEEAENGLASFYQRNRRVSDSPVLTAQEGRLQRQVAMNQQVYVALYQSLQAARLQATRNTPVISEIDRPEGFVQRRARGTARNTVLGFLAGIVVAVLLAFGGEYLRTVIAASPSEYEEFVAARSSLLAALRGGFAWRKPPRRAGSPESRTGGDLGKGVS